MIENYSFGKIVVNGVTYSNDIKIIQGNVAPHWRRKSGHLVEVEDVKDIIKLKPDILVIGKGKPGLMKSSQSLREALQNNGIELIEESTSKAVDTFNLLGKEKKAVSAGFHLTC